MDGIKQWVLSIAISAVVGAIILMLSPGGATDRSVKTAVSLFLMASLMSPFIKNVDFSLPEIEVYEQSDEVKQSDLNQVVTDEFKAAVEKKIGEILTQCGINEGQVNIDITVDGEEMKIEKAEILARGGGDFQQAQKRIESELGIRVKIGVSE